MADQHARKMQALLQAFVTALQRNDEAAARYEHRALMAAAQAGRMSSAHSRVPLPAAILDACASLLEERGLAASMTVEILDAVNAVAVAGGSECPGADLLGHAHFARCGTLGGRGSTGFLPFVWMHACP